MPVIGQNYQWYLKGTSDGFLMRVGLTGTTPTMSSYFGGTGADQISGVATDDSHTIYFAGTTNSSNLPVSPGAASTGCCSADGTHVYPNDCRIAVTLPASQPQIMIGTSML